ncbi:hypothetical protein TNIN_242171 [Trichonephila inaurata madagascariensis]|uniref:Uncharacterized protein n=1 Tax=Trichonephila inaurata madagascariensis TaxID=2747483 RepID=A0A8X7CAB5_9ARAC|nr:hypothetical protein TNIN_242171 [Trichonephila inaurata madagascariensis]
MEFLGRPRFWWIDFLEKDLKTLISEIGKVKPRTGQPEMEFLGRPRFWWIDFLEKVKTYLNGKENQKRTPKEFWKGQDSGGCFPRKDQKLFFGVEKKNQRTGQPEKVFLGRAKIRGLISLKRSENSYFKNWEKSNQEQDTREKGNFFGAKIRVDCFLKKSENSF